MTTTQRALLAFTGGVIATAGVVNSLWIVDSMQRIALFVVTVAGVLLFFCALDEDE